MSTNLANPPSIFDRMPASLRQAQAAIELPEVQEILKKLSAYNLGVCMPHMHNDETGDFEALPDGLVQVENDLKVQFVDQQESDRLTTAVPVAWIWKKEGIQASAACIAKCTLTTTPGGKDFHKDEHKGGGHPFP